MLKFLDTQTQAKIGNVAFAILEDGTLKYGVIRDIKNDKAVLGYEGNYKNACQVYEHYPDCLCVYIPNKANINKPVQLSLFS